MSISPHDIARVLSEALPHMQRYDEEIVVVKYGGHAMGEEEMARSFARDIVLMEQTAINPVVVHGGGPQIGDMLKRLGIKSEFAAGLRVTDKATIEIVEMVLAGSINKQIVGFINGAGGKAVGLCGKDGNMVMARKINRTIADPGSSIEKVIDLGFVGEVVDINREVLLTACRSGAIPVIPSIALDEHGQKYNVNADTAAAAVARILDAEKLVFLSDVSGIYLDRTKPETLVSNLTERRCRELIADGTIDSGMVPKVEAALDALTAGVKKVHIVDGRMPHSLLVEIFSDKGVGTEIVA